MVDVHQHKYFMAQLKKEFEPVIEDGENMGKYYLVEYAYMVCNCTSVVKKRVLSV